MSSTTPNYHLIKPGLNDDADMTVLNENWTKLDTILHQINTKVLEIDSFVRNIGWESSLTPNRVIVSNSSGAVSVSTITTTLLEYLSGLQSNVQDQIDGLDYSQIIQELSDDVDDLKSSVSNGKSAIAGAITDRGVSTSGSDSFATMAANIQAIDTAPVNGRNGKWVSKKTLPSVQCWTALAYGNGRIVMISGYPGANGEESDVCAYSEDGLTWTEATLPGSYGWSDITFGDGVFLAVTSRNKDGSYSRVCAKSTDGVTWTSYTSLPSSMDIMISRVTYGKGKFVAIISDNKIAYSANEGSSWTTKTLNLESEETTTSRRATLRDITYADGLFVAIAENGVIAYSEDAITWSYAQLSFPESAISTSYYSNVLYGKGVFVASGYRCHAYSQNKCISWTVVNAESGGITGGTGRGCYGNGTFVGSSGYSINGKVPIGRTSGGSVPKYIIYADDKFIGTSYNMFDSGKEYWYSPTTVDN